MESTGLIFHNNQDDDNVFRRNSSFADLREKRNHGMQICEGNAKSQRSFSTTEVEIHHRISITQGSTEHKSDNVRLTNSEKRKTKGWDNSDSSSANSDTENGNWIRCLSKTSRENETQKTPVCSRKVQPLTCIKSLPLRNITNTPQSRPSSKSLKLSPFTHHKAHPKVNRKRPMLPEKKTEKRHKIMNDSIHKHEQSNPKSSRSPPRLHLSNLVALSVEENNLTNLSSPESSAEYSLKIVQRPQKAHGAFKSISAETLSELLSSMSDEDFQKKFFLVDCRYPYEYMGGHIRNAVNIFDTSQVKDIFYPEDADDFAVINSKIPIFYCEYSQVRSPHMARELRKLDRSRNETEYPFVNYKEIYLLDRGYKHFYEVCNYSDFCDPKNYVPMQHPEYETELNRYHFHKERRTTHKTKQRLINNYFRARKMVGASPRKQSKLKSENFQKQASTSKSESSVVSQCSSGSAQNIAPHSSTIGPGGYDTVRMLGYGMAQSPISSTAFIAAKDVKQLPPLLSSLSMESPSPIVGDNQMSGIARLGRRLFSFSSINEVASCSWSSSESSIL